MNLDALRTARNMVIARGWAPAHPFNLKVADHLGARDNSGPVSMITALADLPGPEYHPLYQALQFVTRAPSLHVWECQPGRTQADVLTAFGAAIQMLGGAQ
jgi:hypothetical protein